MATLSEATISTLLAPYLDGDGSPSLYARLSTYLDLLLKWNARTNLTAIRNPEEIVRRHFGESLFAARHIAPCKTLLDFGSGAGFPGLPIQLLRPEIAVTLAESQNKKASFLREAVRTLSLKTEVWGERVETMPPNRRFDVVCLRAVDNMPAALLASSSRISPDGERVLLTTADMAPSIGKTLRLPNSETGVLHLEMFHVEQST